MIDYKNVIFQRIKKIDRSIEKSLKKFDIIERKVYHLKNKKKSSFISICIVLSLFAVTLLYFIFIAKPAKKIDNNGISYIGQVKLKEEYESLTNSEALGGNVVSSFETNSSELKFFFYKIKQGETLTTISKKLGVTMDTLISLNSMENAHSLGEGKRIIVPNLQGILYTIKKDDNIDAIAKKYKISVSDIQDANDMDELNIEEGNILFLPGAQLTADERAKALGYLFMKPLRGHFTSGFGIRRDPFTGEMGYHPGIDIAAPFGSSVRAAKEGRVEFVGWNGGYGKCIIIKHLFGYETVYGHLSSIGVQKDAWITAGQYIGRVGTTGYSTGAHLHFEIRKFGRPTNPLRLAGLTKFSGIWY